MKGQVGQVEHRQENMHMLNLNPKVGFRCLHYSVTESSGFVELALVKRSMEEFDIGVRTVNGTANAGEDYVAVDEIIRMREEDREKSVRVKIIDDEGWEPDEDFFVELYHPVTKKLLPGDDTKCKITILDEDQPGVLGFEERHIKVRRKDGRFFLKIQRNDGSDGIARAKIQTEVLAHIDNQAVQHEDFSPFMKQLLFEHQMTEQIVEI